MWILLTFAAIVIIPTLFALIQRFFQNRDLKRQLSGKIPIREAKTDPGRQKENVNLEMEAERARMDAINAGNAMGGH